MRKRLIAFLKVFLFISFGVLILTLLFRSQINAYAEQCLLDGIPEEDCNYFEKLWSDLKSVNYAWLLLVLFLYLLSNFSRALRWKLMFTPLGFKIRTINAFGTVMIGYFANLGLPRMGEIIRPAFLSNYERIKVEKVLGTIVAERALDFVMLFLFIGLALIFEFDILWSYLKENETLSSRLIGLVTNPIFLIIIVALGTTMIYFLFSKQFKQSKIGQKFYNLASGFMDGLKAIFKLKKPGLFILHTFFIWGMYYFMTRICFLSFPPTSVLGLNAALMVFVMGSLGIVFPSPGGMGSYHALVMAGLALYGISLSDGFSYANIIFFAIQIFCNVLVGLLAWLLLPLYNKDYQGAEKI